MPGAQAPLGSVGTMSGEDLAGRVFFSPRPSLAIRAPRSASASKSPVYRWLQLGLALGDIEPVVAP
jgi:hypothetical protein